MSNNPAVKRHRNRFIHGRKNETISECNTDLNGFAENRFAGVGHAVSSAQSERSSCTLLGECVGTDHPTLKGRLLVKWLEADGKTTEKWLPALQNLAVRNHDRLLLVKPENGDEMIVTGVVDGFAKRPEVARRSAAHVTLEPDEAIRVTSKYGGDLLELFQSESGPVIRVLQKDTAVELPGKLRLVADSIELEAGAGPIHIRATDDIRINGEMIHLN